MSQQVPLTMTPNWLHSTSFFNVHFIANMLLVTLKHHRKLANIRQTVQSLLFG